MEGLYHKIVNPVTGRKVKINSKLGRHILNNYLHNQTGGSGNGATEYKKQMKTHSGAINKIAETLNQDHTKIQNEHTSKLQQLEEAQDQHQLDIRHKHKESYKQAAKQYHDNQDKFHKAVKKDNMKCYRSKKKGTCELEPYFLGVDENINDEDIDGEKCSYDTSSLDCYANFNNWTSSDYTKLHDTLHNLDYDEENNLFWRQVDGKQVPFTTSQRSSDLIGKGHGTLNHF